MRTARGSGRTAGRTAPCPRAAAQRAPCGGRRRCESAAGSRRPAGRRQVQAIKQARRVRACACTHTCGDWMACVPCVDPIKQAREITATAARNRPAACIYRGLVCLAPGPHAVATAVVHAHACIYSLHPPPASATQHSTSYMRGYIGVPEFIVPAHARTSCWRSPCLASLRCLFACLPACTLLRTHAHAAPLDGPADISPWTGLLRSPPPDRRSNAPGLPTSAAPPPAPTAPPCACPW